MEAEFQKKHVLQFLYGTLGGWVRLGLVRKNSELKAIVEADSLQTMSEFAAGCGVSDKTLLINLKQIGKVKFERCVPHELIEAN